MSTTQRRSSLLVATLFIVLLALMATFGVRSAEAQGPPDQPKAHQSVDVLQATSLGSFPSKLC